MTTTTPTPTATIAVEVPAEHADRVRQMFANGARGFYGAAAVDGAAEDVRALVASILAQLSTPPAAPTDAELAGTAVARALGDGWWVRPVDTNKVAVHGPEGVVFDLRWIADDAGHYARISRPAVAPVVRAEASAIIHHPGAVAATVRRDILGLERAPR
jgi:hypothetical protein